MYRVLIADDELPVLQGLQMIIDWHSLGFTVCAAVRDGNAALEQILTLRPELVLADIRMPGMDGIQVMEAARHKGYNGYFIVLSGASDFGYAQRAIRCKASFYLTKPIDEDELAEAVAQIAAELANHSSLRIQLEQHTRQKQLFQLFAGISEAAPDSSLLQSPDGSYQVVACESYGQELDSKHPPLEVLLRAAGAEAEADDVLPIDNREFCLLRSGRCTRQLGSALAKLREGGEPPTGWEQAFFCFGRPVHTPEEIVLSYCDAVKLMQRRYFIAPERHAATYGELPEHRASSPLDAAARGTYAKNLTDCIQAQNPARLRALLRELGARLAADDLSVTACKLFLTEIYTAVRQQVNFLYRDSLRQLRSETSSVKLIDESRSLFEALTLLESQFTAFSEAIHTGSGEDIIARMREYIDRNCAQPLRLEELAALFGYNASYLGKLFRDKAQCSFNEYLDKVRIERAKELLSGSTLRVYEIAAQLGYKDVDYFHKKFKKYTGVSPNEYRRAIPAGEWFVPPPPIQTGKI